MIHVCQYVQLVLQYVQLDVHFVFVIR